MKDSLKVFVGVFLVGCVIATAVLSSYRARINRWAESHGEVIKDIDYRTMRTGPYWPAKNVSFYRVETDKGVYWFRFGLWKTIKKEVGEDKYIEVND